MIFQGFLQLSYLIFEASEYVKRLGFLIYQTNQLKGCFPKSLWNYAVGCISEKSANFHPKAYGKPDFFNYLHSNSNRKKKRKMGCEESQLSKSASAANQVPVLETKGAAKRRIIHQNINGRASTLDFYQNIKRLDFPKTTQDTEFIQKTISKHFLLFKLSRQERRELANAMECYETMIGEYVFKQGTPASMFFIIRQGQVDIEVNNVKVKTMKKGDFFGELALIYSSPRSASVKANQKCSFWCLSQQLFQKIQREMVKHNYKVAKPLVNKLPLFSYLNPKQKDSISYSMNTLKYEQGEAIFKAGDDAVSFFVIVCGVVEISIPGKPNIKFKDGDSFGENCLKDSQIRSGTAFCLEKTELLAISREDLKNCLGNKSLEELLYFNILKWSLRRSKLFKKHPHFDQSRIIKSGQFYLKNDQEVILDVGETEDKAYICLEGKVNDFEIGAIINQQEAMDENVESFVSQKRLLKKQYGYIFGISLRVIQRQRKAKIKGPHTLKKLELKSEITRSRNESVTSKVQLKDLYILCQLGEGQMGKVYLVAHKQNEKRFALKCIEKDIVVRQKMQKFIKCQKEILQTINSPFVVKLHQTYKDTHFVYLLLSYIEGGDFFDFLQDAGSCNSVTAQFYFGCLLLGIQYLHRNQIIYRDLKPENAVIDSKGYLALIDLGTSKFLQDDDQSGFRTFTLIGTPHYMAPEIISAKGYSFEVDIWSLGVILYEMVCSCLPFGGDGCDDPAAIYKQIQENSLTFPKSYRDVAGKELISRLLQKNPEIRGVEDFSEIKNMEYFKSFNWNLLEGQKLNAPVKPKICDEKFNSKSQNLVSYLQKIKLGMDKPLEPRIRNWDQIF